jgi:hypothetical protein
LSRGVCVYNPIEALACGEGDRDRDRDREDQVGSHGRWSERPLPAFLKPHRCDQCDAILVEPHTVIWAEARSRHVGDKLLVTRW